MAAGAWFTFIILISLFAVQCANPGERDGFRDFLSQLGIPVPATTDLGLRLSPLPSLKDLLLANPRDESCYNCPDLDPKSALTNCPPNLYRGLKCGEFEIYYQGGLCRTAKVYCRRNMSNQEVGVNVGVYGMEIETNYTSVFLVSHQDPTGYVRPFILEHLRHGGISVGELVCKDGRWVLDSDINQILIENIFCVINFAVNLNFLLDFIPPPKVTAKPFRRSDLSFFDDD